MIEFAPKPRWVTICISTYPEDRDALDAAQVISETRGVR